MLSLEDRIEAVLRRRRCATLAELAAEARATPSEVAEAARRLEESGVARLSGGMVCLAPGGRRRRLLRDLLEEAGMRVEEVGGALAAWRGDGVCFVVAEAPHGPPEAVSSAAERLARRARRLAEEGRARLAVPVLVSRRGRGRLVEGVPLVPLRELTGILQASWRPGGLVRVYEAPRGGSRGSGQRPPRRGGLSSHTPP